MTVLSRVVHQDLIPDQEQAHTLTTQLQHNTQNTKLLPVLYEVLSSSVSLSVCYTITQIAINESLPDLHDQ